MPREKDSRLTEDQLIAAELLVYGATNKEVADQLDVCEKTIMRWKKRPEFMEELDRQYEVAKNKVDNRIMKFSNQLLQNILDLSRSAKSEKVRLDASIYLLNRLAGAPISKVETKTVITPETEKENNNEPSWDDFNDSDVIEGNVTVSYTHLTLPTNSRV